MRRCNYGNCDEPALYQVRDIAAPGGVAGFCKPHAWLLENLRDSPFVMEPVPQDEDTMSKNVSELVLSWRSGPEELPAEGVEVLTWRNGEYKLTKLSKSRGGYWGDWVETASGGCSCGANWGDAWHAREPTFWMALPESPK